MMVLTLAQRELRTLFLSPLAWAILATIQLVLFYIFAERLEDFRLEQQLDIIKVTASQAEGLVAEFYLVSSFIFMMVIPLLTMRLVSEERRNRTIELLFSAPVSMTEIIIGKYLGLLSFLFLAELLISLTPLSLLLGGPLDIGLLLAMMVAVFLLLACFAAIGLFMSTLTQQPIIAAISTYGALLLLWVLDWADNQIDQSITHGLLAYISIMHHFISLLDGLVSTVDIFYFVLIVAFFLILSIRRLDAYRLQH